MNHQMLSGEMLAFREIDSTNSELRARNQERADAMKISMGNRWVLHSDNSPPKQMDDRVLTGEAYWNQHATKLVNAFKYRDETVGVGV